MSFLGFLALRGLVRWDWVVVLSGLETGIGFLVFSGLLIGILGFSDIF